LTSPMDISNLIGWWDASQITGLNDGDPVSLWPDLSGSGYDLAQSVGTQQPLYKTDGNLLLPQYVSFDGIDDSLDVLFGASFSVPNTIVLIGKLNDPFLSGSYKVLFSGNSSNLYTLWRWSGNPTYCYYYNGGAAPYCYVDYAEFERNGSIVICFNGSDSYVRFNRSVAQANMTTGTSALLGFTLGSMAGAAYFANVDVHEAMIYSKALTQEEAEQLETYAAEKWGYRSYFNDANDYFTRTASSITMGSCSTGQIWTAGSYQDADNPVLGISSNMGYFPSTPGTDSHAYIETGLSDCVITSKITFDSTVDSDKGIVFRREDANNYFYLHLDTAADALVLSKCLAGVRDRVASVALAGGLSSIATTRCYLSGSSIKAGLTFGLSASSRQLEVTDTDFLTATKHGLYNQSGNEGAFSYFFVDTILGYLMEKLADIASSVPIIRSNLEALATSVSAIGPVLSSIASALPVVSADSSANVLMRDVIGNKTDTIDGDSLYAFSVLLRDTLIPTNGTQMYPDRANLIEVPNSTTRWVTSNTFTTIVTAGVIPNPFVLDFACIDLIYPDEAYQLDLYSGNSGSEVLVASAYWSNVGVWQQAPIKTPIIPAGTRISAKFASSAPAMGYASYFKIGYHML
jgi:hypothetical protein